jgi:ketosteroid isomerase-like protein
MFSPPELALEFVKRINAHDVDLIAKLMSETHTFTDALGLSVTGREPMRTGWAGYFEWFPDYKIVLTDIMQQGHIVGLFGTASGTFAVKGELHPENHWEIPSAWKAVMGGGFVTEWHVYGDNEPVSRVMAANPSK